jgi:hypothetical protein
MRQAAIPTRFDAHLFRSRLEARWAAWFTLMGIEWTYEPFDAAGYIPDFIISYPRDPKALLTAWPVLIEVRGLECDHPALYDGAIEADRRSVAGGLSARDGHAYDIVVLCATPVFPDDHEDPGEVGAWLHHYERHVHDRIVRPGVGKLLGEIFFHGVSGRDQRAAWGRAHEMSRWMPKDGARVRH